MEEVTRFLQWFADHFSHQRYQQVLEDMELSRRGFWPSSVEAAVAGRDAAWRLYALASLSCFAAAVQYFYESYEVICCSLIQMREGRW